MESWKIYLYELHDEERKTTIFVDDSIFAHNLHRLMFAVYHANDVNLIFANKFIQQNKMLKVILCVNKGAYRYKQRHKFQNLSWNSLCFQCLKFKCSFKVNN